MDSWPLKIPSPTESYLITRLVLLKNGAWKTAQEAYEVECRKKRPGKATNTKALVARSDAAVAAFEGLGIPGAVAREAVKRGSGAVAYLLVHGELDV